MSVCVCVACMYTWQQVIILQSLLSISSLTSNTRTCMRLSAASNHCCQLQVCSSRWQTLRWNLVTVVACHFPRSCAALLLFIVSVLCDWNKQVWVCVCVCVCVRLVMLESHYQWNLARYNKSNPRAALDRHLWKQIHDDDHDRIWIFLDCVYVYMFMKQSCLICRHLKTWVAGCTYSISVFWFTLMELDYVKWQEMAHSERVHVALIFIILFTIKLTSWKGSGHAPLFFVFLLNPSRRSYPVKHKTTEAALNQTTLTLAVWRTLWAQLMSDKRAARLSANTTKLFNNDINVGILCCDWDS